MFSSFIVTLTCGCGDYRNEHWKLTFRARRQRKRAGSPAEIARNQLKLSWPRTCGRGQNLRKCGTRAALEALGTVQPWNCSLGRLEKALEMHEKDLEIKLNTVGIGHACVVTTKFNIGNVYKQLGKFAHAQSFRRIPLSSLRLKRGRAGSVPSG